MMRRAVRSLVQCVVVVLSFGAGIASAILAVRAVPPVEIAPRVTEGTPVQLVVFGSLVSLAACGGTTVVPENRDMSNAILGRCMVAAGEDADHPLRLVEGAGCAPVASRGAGAVGPV